MADSTLKKVFSPAGMVEPPRKTAEAVKLPAPEIPKVKGLGLAPPTFERVKTK